MINIESYLFLIYLSCVMIICGILKEYNLMTAIYNKIIDKFQSKKLIVFLISCISGILPIPGRVVISAGILSTVTSNEKSKSKYGIIDFLATHHYYWWSPLEKTVIIPMAALGLSYLAFMQYAWVPLLISLLFCFYYIFIVLNEKDILINKLEHNNIKPVWISVLPIIISIVLLCINIQPYIIFPIVSLFYIVYCKVFSWRKLNNYINWNLILITAIVILIANIAESKSKEILSYLNHLTVTLNIHELTGFILISLISFTIVFVLGSSAKYAGIVSILCGIYGVQYLTYFLTLEFFAYILSPTHKCVLISSKYFNTPLKEYYKILFLWGSILLSYGILTIVLR